VSDGAITYVMEGVSSACGDVICTLIFLTVLHLTCFHIIVGSISEIAKE
jgi:hypothetical protein